MDVQHTPVLADEVVNFIGTLSDNVTIVDATTGEGGHSERFLRAGCSVVCCDRDREILEKARERLKDFPRVTFALCTYDRIDEALPAHVKGTADAMLFDLGVSMYHFRNAHRGFSFREDGPLDMRLSLEQPLTAADVVNTYPVDSIEQLLRNYGEIPYANRIAEAIATARENHRIATTGELEEIAFRATPKKFRYGRTHPATRVFQALRIEVNDEINILTNALERALPLVKIGGVIVVISYHSLEDRVVKQFMRAHGERYGDGTMETLTKSVVTASDVECAANAAARSAKLRAGRRLI